MQNNYDKYLPNLGFTAFNSMQTSIFEASEKHQSIVLLSPTGSGKTVGFLLPLTEGLSENIQGIQALIIAPSRELAIQIEQVFKSIKSGFKITCCYGGHNTRIEKNSLLEPPAVLIGTPGRLAYHIEHGNVDPSRIHTLVLDEFDKALEFGFQNDMGFIISELKSVKKKLLTSATAMDEIPGFAGMAKPHTISFLEDTAKNTLTLKKVMAEGEDKLDALFRLLCTFGNAATLVFCNHRDAVERISDLLHDLHLKHDIFHGGMLQEDRERALIKFRNGSHHVLITTDLAARGLDIDEIQHVVHYQLPTTEDAFIHRNGRTARMHADGSAYLLLAENDYVPTFVKEDPELVVLPSKVDLPELPAWTTIFINKGKKDKVNKIDIVGLMFKKGKLDKDELGRIDVLDHSSFVAVKSKKAKHVVQLLKDERIKNKKAMIVVAR